MRDAEKFQILDESRNCLIQPEDILKAGFEGAFGKYEVEEIAQNLVQFCKERGGWKSFTISELYEFYLRNDLNPDKMFFGLLGGWFDGMLLGWIDAPSFFAFDYEGKCYVTDLFVKKCAKNVVKKE